MPKIKKIDPDRLNNLFTLHKEGFSLTQLGKISGISRQTLTRLFKKHYPLEFGSARYGLERILQEHMRSSSLNEEQKQELADWIKENQEKIAASDQSTSTNLYTEAQLQARTISECGSKKDWQPNLIDPQNFI